MNNLSRYFRILSIVVLYGLLIFSSCTRPRPAPGGGDPSIPPFTSNESLPDTVLRPDPVNCLPGSIKLINQRNTMTLALTLDPGGFVDVTAVTATNGTYLFRIQNLQPDCSSPLGPPIGPIAIQYGFNYAGSFTRGDEICIDASRLSFTSFTVSGIAALDNVLEDYIKDKIHRRTDFEMADRMNRLLNGSPLPADDDARCSNWILLPPNIAPGF